MWFTFNTWVTQINSEVQINYVHKTYRKQVNEVSVFILTFQNSKKNLELHVL